MNIKDAIVKRHINSIGKVLYAKISESALWLIPHALIKDLSNEKRQRLVGGI
jgi:hypothetical protein